MKKLHEKTWLAILLVSISYLICLIVTDLTIRISGSHSFFTNSLISMAYLLALVMFFIYILMVPDGKIPFFDYFRSIRLSMEKGWKFIVIVSLGFSAVFSISHAIGSIIYYLVFQERLAIDINNHSLFDSDTILSSITEEIVWRGVILSLLLKKYSENKAITISAFLFGCFHLFYLINPSVEYIWVISQSVWAIGFGYLYGTLFVRTNSLIPSLLIHYLVNALAGIWFAGLNNMDSASAIFGIFFFGWLPVIVCLTIIYHKYVYSLNN